MIVLTVLIIAIAIVVGINIFRESAVKSNRNAIIADLNQIAASALAYYRAPSSMGGGGGHWIPFTNGEVDKSKGDQLGKWLSFPDYTESSSGDYFTTPNGVFWMNLTSWTSDVLIIVGSGYETGKDPNYSSAGNGETGCVEVRMTVTGQTKEINLEIKN